MWSVDGNKCSTCPTYFGKHGQGSTCHSFRNSVKRNFTPRDVVLIVDDSAPRNSWIMGRITETRQEMTHLAGEDQDKDKLFGQAHYKDLSPSGG